MVHEFYRDISLPDHGIDFHFAAILINLGLAPLQIMFACCHIGVTGTSYLLQIFIEIDTLIELAGHATRDSDGWLAERSSDRAWQG